MIYLQDQAPGNHPTLQLCQGGIPTPLNLGTIYYCQLSTDTLISIGIAAVLTLLFGFWVASHLRSDVPGKFQMIFELIWSFTAGLVHESVADDADFIIPFAFTIGFFIFIANWIDFLPLAGPVHPATFDWNVTLGMALVVILTVQGYSIRVLGLGGYFRRFTRPFELALPLRIVFIPLNIIEEVVKPVTLSLRLFGNIFASLVMVYLLGELFSYGLQLLGSGQLIGGIPATVVAFVALVLWKGLLVPFVSTVQAFIFMLLTIIYFGMAREGLEEEHGAASHSEQRRIA